jgi:hypothetical protein
MAQNPLRKPDRIFQIKRDANDVKKSVTLFDVDSAMLTYLEDVVLPKLDDNGISIKIPVIYGNSERWNGARRQGVYRDMHGKIQLPIMMLRRTTIAKNDIIPMFNRHVSYQTITRWSKDNRYDRFGLMTGASPKYDMYNVTMPDYVDINYECMGWASFTEQLNTIIESLTWASDEYWGDKTKFKFNTTITDYTVVNEVGEGTERINRVEFSMNVKAYLLPEQFDGESTTKKGFNISKIILSNEVDLTANGRLENLLVNETSYNSNKDVVDYLAINTTNTATVAVANTITFSGIKLIPPPTILAGGISTSLTANSIGYDVKVYKNTNTLLTQGTDFVVTYANNNLVLTSLNASIGDAITIIGKFINL